jgi:hypothetical protein
MAEKPRWRRVGGDDPGGHVKWQHDIRYNVKPGDHIEAHEPSPQAETDPELRPREPEEYLERLPLLKAAADAAKLALEQTVIEAHASGVSWTKIGKVLGLTTSQVQRRWDENTKAKQRDYMQNYRYPRRSEEELDQAPEHHVAVRE